MFGYKRRAEQKCQAEWDAFVDKWRKDHPDGKPLPVPMGIGDRYNGWLFYPVTKEAL